MSLVSFKKGCLFLESKNASTGTRALQEVVSANL